MPNAIILTLLLTAKIKAALNPAVYRNLKRFLYSGKFFGTYCNRAHGDDSVPSLYELLGFEA